MKTHIKLCMVAVALLLASGIPVVLAIDLTPPEIISATASPDVLWPVNHEYVDVTVTVVAVDDTDPDPLIRIVGLIVNQRDDGMGDGNTRGDYIIVDDNHVKLRAERSGTGFDRRYYIVVAVTDDSGNTSYANIIVRVPHDMGN